MSMAALGNKSPNLQSPPNVAVSKDQMGGMHQNMLPNAGQHQASMQGTYRPRAFFQSRLSGLKSTVDESGMNVGGVLCGTGGMLMAGGGVMGVGVGMTGGLVVGANKPPLPVSAMGPAHHGQHHAVQVSFFRRSD